jgi:peptidoglycan hydrolase-like protein with peptidoglycan-binding domain
MRILKQQAALMSGVDVLLWQNFLNQVGLPVGVPDSVFGPRSSEKSSAYQTRVGIFADGVIAPRTVERARQDGFQPPVIMGVDTNANCTRFADCIRTAGMEFAVRYYASPENSSKVLTRKEALALSAAGLELVPVFENTANLADFTGEAGEQHANDALACATAVGQPDNTAIYFGIDFEVELPDIKGRITDYFTAIKGVIGNDQRGLKIGVYGSGLTCRTLRNAGLAAYTWTSQSTSFHETVAFCTQANMAQCNPTRKICGTLSVDDNVALTADFGTFRLS